MCLVTSDPIPSSEPLLRLQIRLKGASGGLMLLSSQPALLRVTLLKSIICPSLTFLALSLTGLQTFYSNQTKPIFFCLFFNPQSPTLILGAFRSLLLQNALLADLRSVVNITSFKDTIKLCLFSNAFLEQRVFKLGIIIAGLH